MANGFNQKSKLTQKIQNAQPINSHVGMGGVFPYRFDVMATSTAKMEPMNKNAPAVPWACLSAQT